MIIPSIDIMDGKAVQLRHGRDFLLDGGDPFKRLEQFSVVGEVAVIDLDAALGKGSNSTTIKEMVRVAPCRVGGGIRDLETARSWLDSGASKIIIGTKATVDFCSQLPKERVIAAVDAERGSVVVNGWQTRTNDDPIERIEELRSVVGGFLLTQVEREGDLAGFDFDLVKRAVNAAGNARVTAAGGISLVEEIGELDSLGADGQVGMALYSNRFSLGEAIGATLRKGIDDRLWPTVVCDEGGVALGLVWSTRESLNAAIEERRGIYWSRSRNELWRKGETSGSTQELIRVDLDCDRDALRFVVRQHGTGFCHTGDRGCWESLFDLPALERLISERKTQADPESGTCRLFADSTLLERKLVEEATELARASSHGEVVHEVADLLYFALVAAAGHDVSLTSVIKELGLRNKRISRRPMVAKINGGLA